MKHVYYILNSRRLLLVKSAIEAVETVVRLLQELSMLSQQCSKQWNSK